MIALGGCTTLCATLGLIGLSTAGFDGGVIAQGNQLVFAAVVMYIINFLNNFLYAHLSAAQRQLAMNVRQTGFLLLKTILTLASTRWISTDVLSYFVAFSLIGLVELLTNVLSTQELQYSLRGIIKGIIDAPKFFKTISGISIGVVIGILAANLDKIYLSSISEAAVFAAYSVTFTVAMYFMQLQYPVMRAFFPVIAKLYHGDDLPAKRRVVWLQLLIINIVIIPPLCIAFYFDLNILALFTLDIQRYPGVSQLFRTLLICVYLNSIYHIFYQQMITSGATKYIFRINVVSLISSAVVLLIFGNAMPILSGGLAWLLMCSIQLCGGFIFMNYWWTNVVR
jgi:O-antigen/teichoic acid export membrane protein